MDSLFGGIASYYVFGVPVMLMTLPMVTFLKPLMGIALSVTLVLTGFACAYVAMQLPKTPTERGVVLLIAVALVAFDPGWGSRLGWWRLLRWSGRAFGDSDWKFLDTQGLNHTVIFLEASQGMTYHHTDGVAL